LNFDYRLLRVDLTTEKTKIEEISIDLLKEYIGGKGLGSKLLLDELEPGIDPLGPKNKIIFVSGPLTGTVFPTSNRYGIIYKSPLTGAFAESYSGGGAVQKMRAAGYFIIIIEGISKRPIYLFITESSVEFRDASHLWGKDTLETYDLLGIKSKKDIDVLVIGPAGENKVKFANIQNNKHHSAGRCGPGAVMGSKKLKAIIFSGTKRPALNKNLEFRKLVKKVINKIHDREDLYGSNGIYRKLGTPSIVEWTNELGCFPTRYFTAGYSEYSKNFDAYAIINQILKKRTGCWNCPFTCSKYVEVEEGPFKCNLEGPEYETIAVFGGICDIRDIKAIAKLNEYCDRMGIDTITAGNLCGLAIEAKHLGILPDNNKFKLDYNKPLELLKFLNDIVYRKGIGNDFAEGIKYISKKYHLEDIAMHVKGLEFPGYDPRAFRGFAISYGVSPEGATHLRSTFHNIERNLPDYLSYENKVAPMIEQEDKMALIDSLIVCKFIRDILDWDLFAEIYNVIFNAKINKDKIRNIASEIITLSRKFNIREGFSRKDDYMPSRVYKESITTKYGKKLNLDYDKYDKMLDEYYSLRGWTKEGIPKE